MKRYPAEEDDFVFSIYTLKDCTFSTESDETYVAWFLREIDRRAMPPLAVLRQTLEGEMPLQHESLYVVLAARAELRRLNEFAVEAAAFFGGLPKVAERFVQAQKTLEPKLAIANEACSKVLVWFKPSSV